MGQFAEPPQGPLREVSDGEERCDLLYFLLRSSVERLRAQVSSDVRAAAVHLEMAEEYDRRARAIVEQDQTGITRNGASPDEPADRDDDLVALVAPSPADQDDLTVTLEILEASQIRGRIKCSRNM